jgi:putative tricarboxylic transport membrane protein
MTKFLRNGDFLAGLVLFVLGFFMLGNAINFGRQIDAAIGADFFPKIISAALIAVSVGLILGGVKAVKAAEAEGSGAQPSKNYPGFAATLGLLILYIFVMPVLGFIIATVPFTFLLILILVPKGKKNRLLFLGISAGITLAAYFLFVKVFFVMLPAGILG